MTTLTEKQLRAASALVRQAMEAEVKAARWRRRCLDREKRLRLLAMWGRKLRVPNSLAGNSVRRLLDLRRPLKTHSSLPEGKRT